MAEPERAGPPAWVARLVPAATFLLGLAVGGLVVGVGLDGDGSPAAESETSAPSPADEESTPSDLTVVVPAACEQAAESVREAAGLLRRAAESVRDFNPDELVAVLDELETVEPQVQELADRCAAVDINPTSP